VSAASAPAAKQAMLTIWAATPALTGVTVTWDGPTKDEDYQPEMMWVGNVEGTEDWSQLGAGRRQETYSVAVSVYVEYFGDDPKTVEQRAWTLWGAATDALRTDLRSQSSTLRTAGGVLQFNGISFRQRTEPATPDKWGAFVDGSITFTARNT
jgi:hypothetical protein